MRILWLADDRSMRVVDFYSPLRHAVSELCEVRTIKRPLDKLEGAFCRDVTINNRKLPPLIEPGYANEFDWIVVDAMWSFMHEGWRKIHTKKAVLWADRHGPMVDVYMRRAKALEFDLYLPLYRDGAHRFQSYLPIERMVWFPYWINARVFRDYGLAKKIGALLTGVVHRQVYPWRQRIVTALVGKSYFIRIPRPVENMKGRYWPVGRDYARLLNSARISFSCCSRYGYPVTKVFEIPACKTVLMSDFVPEMKDLGFVSGKNFLPLEKDEDLAAQVEYRLHPARASDLNDIAEAGFRLIRENHTVQRRAQALIEILQSH